MRSNRVGVQHGSQVGAHGGDYIDNACEGGAENEKQKCRGENSHRPTQDASAPREGRRLPGGFAGHAAVDDPVGRATEESKEKQSQNQPDDLP